ncbi:MAG: UDP-N-acetylmuramoyl-tripeptide--D-alanyl-D-alanine ligase [Nitrospirae bacterium]|nr:UDP-N-acetylmuramoyl-tripeptide--D-alanyl-D-alanine ligase [Nitrospirota bacterium]
MEKVIEATEGRLIAGDGGAFTGVSIDTRTIKEGDLFFAIRGDRFDGHDFLKDAFSRCMGAVVDTEPLSIPESKAVVHVGDTLKALQDLAHFIRKERDIPVIAITGSNGKTTTKEMTYAILSQRYRVLKNEGNLNNHIGLPLTLTRLAKDDDAAVLELGMNAPGEIRRLCEISLPTHGVVTNIGTAHLGMLGSREAIRSAKLEILPGLGVAVLNADDDLLMSGIKGFKGEVITFAIKKDAHVTAKDLRLTEDGSAFTLCIKDKGSVGIALKVHGIFNVYNALAAAAVSSSLGIPLSAVKPALENYRPFSMRFEVMKFGEITLINDAYNANPASMKESLKEMAAMGDGSRLVAVLGDMFELGDFSEVAHRELGNTLSEMGIDVFAAVGELMNFAADEYIKARGEKPSLVYRFSSSGEAGENIMDILKPGDTVLFKGSRSMKLENAIRGVRHAV